MLIVCPSCASEYALDPERIGERGRKVRCAVCRTTWLVHRPENAGNSRDARTAKEEAAGTAAAAGTTIEAVPHQAPPADPASKRRKRRGKPRSPAPSRLRERLAAAAIAVVLIATPTALALRDEVVRRIPASASAFAAVGLGVNLVGLELADISAAIGQEGSARILFIEGEIRSMAGQTAAVPRLELAIESKDGAPLYRWSVKPPIAELAQGQTARFTARLASPPPDGAKLLVTFQPPRGDQSVALR